MPLNDQLVVAAQPAFKLEAEGGGPVVGIGNRPEQESCVMFVVGGDPHTGEYIVVRDSQARIPRSQFDKAQKMWPVTGPSRLVGVYAPSVVWAVMKELNEAEEPAIV